MSINTFCALALATILLTPFSVSAADTGLKGVGARCLYNSECSSGSCGWLSSGFSCEAGASSGSGANQGLLGAQSLPGGGGGGINVYYLTQYRDDALFIVNGLLAPVLIAIAFLYFLWGVYNYFILGASEPKNREEGRRFVIWAVFGFVVIFSLWGLVGLAGNTFSLQPGGVAPSYPLL